MNVKDMKEFIKDLPDDTKLYMHVADTKVNGKNIAVFADICHGVGFDLKLEDKVEVVFLPNQKDYDGFIHRSDLFKNTYDAHWD